MEGAPGGSEEQGPEPAAEGPAAEGPVAVVGAGPDGPGAAAASAEPGPEGTAAPEEALAAAGGGELQAAVDELPADVAARLPEEVARIIGACDLGAMTMAKVRGELELSLGLAPGAMDCEGRRAAVEQLVREQVAARECGREAEGGEGEEEQQEPGAADGPSTPPPGAKAGRRRTRGAGGGKEPREKRRRQKAPLPEGLPVEALQATIGGQAVSLGARAFSSGRSGYFACEALSLKAGGRILRVQCLVQCAVLGVEDEEEEGGEATAQDGPTADRGAEEAPRGAEAPGGAEGDAAAEEGPAAAAGGP